VIQFIDFVIGNLQIINRGFGNQE